MVSAACLGLTRIEGQRILQAKEVYAHNTRAALRLPVALLFGTAPTLYGPWNWTDLSGGDLPAGKKTHIFCTIFY